MEYIWHDRKRYLGMPLSFTRYALSEDRLFLSYGFLSIKDEELLLYRVRDISTSRSIWQRIFGVGTVTVISSDKNHFPFGSKEYQAAYGCKGTDSFSG